jgi:hypothetical protein
LRRVVPQSVAGNGEKMAVATSAAKEKAKKTTTVSRTPKGKAAKDAGRKRVDGLEKLRREADRKLGLNAKRLVALLTTLALDGKLDNTKELVALAEKKKPEEDTAEKRALHAFIDEWAYGPQWKRQQEEGLGEVGEGGVEPEGW